MNTLSFLIIKKFKNRLIEIIKKPSQLIMMLVFVLLIGFTVFSGETGHSQAPHRDINEFYSAVMLLYTFAFILVSKNGFSNGASMFSMADVNLIFVSPFKNTSVLFYGLISQLGRSLTLGLFILYQSALVRSTYGVTFGGLVVVLVGYGLTVFLSQMLAMLIYSLTSSDDKKCNIAKTVYYSVIGVFAAYLVLSALKMGSFNLQNLVAASKSVVIRFFPVSGATALAVEGVLSQNTAYIICALIYVAIFCALFYAVVYFLGNDYYEDVLKSAEVSFSAITSRKEGKVQENVPRNIKTGKTGFDKGFGASVLFEKHKKENRRSRTFSLNGLSLVFIGLSVVYSFIMPDPVAIFALNAYMLTMGVASGRWAKELTLPYVYLIPEKSSKKLFYILKEQIPHLIIESILCFIPVYFILHLTIFETVGMIVARVSFGFIFTGINLLLQRLFGHSDKKLLVLMVYFLFIVLFTLPSIASAVFINGFLPFNPEFSYIAMAIVNTVISAVLIFCCRNILQFADYNNK